MTMPDHAEWTDRLSAYLDGELPPPVRAELERHLAGCEKCRAVLEDLRAITAWAPAYQGEAPARDLWPAIARSVTPEARDSAPVVPLRPRSPDPHLARRPRSTVRRFTMPQLVAASVAVAAVAAGGTWLATRVTGRPPAGPGGPGGPGAGSAPVVVRSVRLTPEQAYDQAVGDLQRALAEGRARLDSATVRIIEANLGIIDRAIAEARAAIAADPGNLELRAWVAATQRRKLDLLRRAAQAAQAVES